MMIYDLSVHDNSVHPKYCIAIGLLAPLPEGMRKTLLQGQLILHFKQSKGNKGDTPFSFVVYSKRLSSSRLNISL